MQALSYQEVEQAKSRVASFGQALNTAGQGDNQTREQQVREASNQLVATSFIKPMLASVRNDPFRSDLFHGGSAEDMFAEHLDTELADRIASRMSLGLGDAISRRMLQLPPRVESGAPHTQTIGIDVRG